MIWSPCKFQHIASVPVPKLRDAANDTYWLAEFGYVLDFQSQVEVLNEISVR